MIKLLALPFGIVAASTFVWGVASRNPAPLRAKKTPTYAEDIAPILNARCVSCHRPGEVAPFSLMGYENARKWSRMVTRTTEKRVMPPWKAVAGYGEFEGENRLSEAEIALLKSWDAAGAPRGNARKEPKPPTFTSEWILGKPDLELSAEKEYKLRADGSDVYRNFILKSDFKEPVWVKAIDVRPGNKAIVHHVIAFLDNNGQAKRLEEMSKDGQPGYTSDGGGVGFLPAGALGGWAPGLRPWETPKGIAYRVNPGQKIVMQVHYHPSGKPETDLTRLGIYFAKEPIEKEIDLHWQFNFQVKIPPGANAHRMERIYTYRQDETIYTVMPHMHLLGRSMKSWLEFPDGTTRPLVNVDDWDFNWQLQYTLKTPIHVPAGTKQHIEAVYDNSAANPRNPNDPPKEVRWGEETTDEMFLMITSYTVDRKAR